MRYPPSFRVSICLMPVV